MGGAGRETQPAGGERNAEGTGQGGEGQQTLRFLSGKLKRPASWAAWGCLRTSCSDLPSSTETVKCGMKSSLSQECSCTASIVFIFLLHYSFLLERLITWSIIIIERKAEWKKFLQRCPTSRNSKIRRRNMQYFTSPWTHKVQCVGPRNRTADPRDGHSRRKCLGEGIASWGCRGRRPRPGGPEGRGRRAEAGGPGPEGRTARGGLHEPPAPPSEPSLEFLLVEFSFSSEWDQVTVAPQQRGAPRRGHPRARAALGRRGRRGRRGTALPPAREIRCRVPGRPRSPPANPPPRTPGGTSHASRPPLGLVTHGQHRGAPTPAAAVRTGRRGGRKRERRRGRGRRRGGAEGAGEAEAEAEGREPTRGEGRGGHSSETLRPPPSPPPLHCSVPCRTPSSLLAPFRPWIPQSFSGVRFSILFLPLSLQQK